MSHIKKSDINSVTMRVTGVILKLQDLIQAKRAIARQIAIHSATLNDHYRT